MTNIFRWDKFLINDTEVEPPKTPQTALLSYYSGLRIGIGQASLEKYIAYEKYIVYSLIFFTVFSSPYSLIAYENHHITGVELYHQCLEC